MNKPKLYLHIGSHKTGTTAIQNSISLNGDYLQSLGFFALNRVFDSFDPLFACLHWNSSKIDLRAEFPLPETLLEDYIQRFSNSGCQNLLISSEEVFPNRPYIDYDFIKQWIKSNFADFDIKIICYLRRQDLYAESMYNQTVKQFDFGFREPVGMLYQLHGNNSEGCVLEDEGDNPLFERFLVNAAPCMQYDRNITKFAEVFGKENIIIRPYEKSQMPNGLIQDFYSNALGLSDGQISELRPIGTMNESLDRDVLEFKLESGIDDRVLFQCVNELLSETSRSENVFLSNKDRKRLVNHYTACNAYIAREYLGRDDGKLFFDEIISYEPYPGLSKERAMEIRKTIIPILRSYYKDSGSANYCEEVEADLSTSSKIIESTRKLYFEQVSWKYVHVKTRDIMELHRGKTVVVYGVYGYMSEWILKAILPYKKSSNVYVADRKIQSMSGITMFNEWFRVASKDAIKAINPDAIIIAATLAGQEIKDELGALELLNTKIYPAYDYADNIWTRLFRSE